MYHQPVAAWKEGHKLNCSKQPLCLIKLSFGDFYWLSDFHEHMKHRTTSVWVTVGQRQTNAWKNLNRIMVDVLLHVWCFPFFNPEGIYHLQTKWWVKFSCPLSEGSTVITQNCLHLVGRGNHYRKLLAQSSCPKSSQSSPVSCFFFKCTSTVFNVSHQLLF